MIDLTDEIDSALKPWTCPKCRITYKPPLTTYISPKTGEELCAACAA
jgi:hypothetical protein